MGPPLRTEPDKTLALLECQALVMFDNLVWRRASAGSDDGVPNPNDEEKWSRPFRPRDSNPDTVFATKKMTCEDKNEANPV